MPISRVVSLTAEATPCLAVGSELTMALVAGVMARPMPAAEQHLARPARPRKPLSASRVEKASIPTPVRARPVPLTSFIPYRIESGAADAEIGIIRNVSGSRATAAFSGL